MLRRKHILHVPSSPFPQKVFLNVTLYCCIPKICALVIHCNLLLERVKKRQKRQVKSAAKTRTAHLTELASLI